MKTRTQQEIEKEIAALEACKAYAPHYSAFGEDNHAKIDLQIEYLRGEIDTTDDAEWDEYSDGERDAITKAQQWKEWDLDESPSSGWDNFKKS